MSKSIRRNVTLNALRILASLLYPLVTFPYVTRVLGPHAVGRYNFVISVISYFLIVAGFGILIYGTREAAKVREDRERLKTIVGQLIAVNTATGAAAAAVLAAAVLFLPFLHQEWELFTVAAIPVVFNFLSLDWIFQADERYGFIALRSIIVQALSVAALFLFVHSPRDLVLYAAISSSALVVNGLVSIPFLPGLHFPADGGWFSAHLRSMLTLFVWTAVINVYANTNTVVLGLLTGKTAVGYYGTSLRLVLVLNNVIGSIGGALLPRSSFYISTNQRRLFVRTLTKALSAVVLLATPLAVGGMIFGGEIIYLFAGNQYGPSVPIFRILAPTMLAVGVGSILTNQVLLTHDRERWALTAVLVAASVSILSAVALIPPFGAIGAAVSTLLTEFAVAVLQVVYSRKITRVPARALEIGKVLIAVAFMGAVAILAKVLIRSQIERLVTGVLLGAATYAVTLCFLKHQVYLELVGSLLVRLRLRPRTESAAGEE